MTTKIGELKAHIRFMVEGLRELQQLSDAPVEDDRDDRRF